MIIDKNLFERIIKKKKDLDSLRPLPKSVLEKIKEDIIKEIHKIILTNIDDEYAGRYRDVNVRILGAIKSPPRFEKVPDKMAEYLEYINKNPDNLNTIELASLIHYKLVEIHPFTDGNGRRSEEQTS